MTGELESEVVAPDVFMSHCQPTAFVWKFALGWTVGVVGILYLVMTIGGF